MPLYGLYEVESFQRNGEVLQPLITDSTYWQYLIIERKGSALTKALNDKYTSFKLKVDSLGSNDLLISSRMGLDEGFKLSLSSRKDSSQTGDFHCIQVDSTLFRLE